MATNSDTLPFTYPSSTLERRHGPSGYADYGSYRPWLRDDFTFRCVYCLIREQWGRLSGEFDLDHFIPQVQNPDRATEYENLLYSCHTCNLRRGSRELPDPCSALTSASIRVHSNGRIEGLTTEATRIVRVLSLNSNRWIQWRRIWVRIVELAEQHDSELHQNLMGYPDDLPNLSELDAPSNTKPEGVEQSYFARQDRGELTDVYVA